MNTIVLQDETPYQCCICIKFWSFYEVIFIFFCIFFFPFMEHFFYETDVMRVEDAFHSFHTNRCTFIELSLSPEPS